MDWRIWGLMMAGWVDWMGGWMGVMDLAVRLGPRGVPGSLVLSGYRYKGETR